MFNVGQAASARAAFRLAGYLEPLRTLPVTSGDERIFVLAENDLTVEQRHDLALVLQNLLQRKVWLIDDKQSGPPFETVDFE
ncbi:hypothetical protein [Oryzihumus sp.]|uniref:hypothetical protein n=1 Tax=Oryzihumus sp. TaxID=1968903 RepID=UPI002EDB65CE